MRKGWRTLAAGGSRQGGRGAAVPEAEPRVVSGAAAGPRPPASPTRQQRPPCPLEEAPGSLGGAEASSRWVRTHFSPVTSCSWGSGERGAGAEQKQLTLQAPPHLPEST